MKNNEVSSNNNGISDAPFDSSNSVELNRSVFIDLEQTSEDGGYEAIICNKQGKVATIYAPTIELLEDRATNFCVGYNAALLNSTPNPEVSDTTGLNQGDAAKFQNNSPVIDWEGLEKAFYKDCVTEKSNEWASWKVVKYYPEKLFSWLKNNLPNYIK